MKIWYECAKKYYLLAAFLMLSVVTVWAQNSSSLSVNCGTSTLTVSGYLSTSNNRIGILLVKDNMIVGGTSDIVGPAVNQTFPLSDSGFYSARLREVNNDANEIISPPIAVNYSSNPGPPTNPDPPTNPPSSGGLAFQVVSYDCNSGVLQYQFTSSSNAPVNVSLPGIFGGTMNPNTVVSYTFPGDGRVGAL